MQAKERSYEFVLRELDVFTKSTVDLRVQNGTAVDPQSCHVRDAHVYRNTEGDIFSAYLAQTNVENWTNTYYKLQVLMSNSTRPCWLLQTRGSIGGASYMYNETEMSLDDAISEFKRIFEKLTGNSWAERATFQKKVCLMQLLELEYIPNIVDDEDIQSHLSEAVKAMVQAMVTGSNSLEVPKIQSNDSRKWPLGKLSSRHLEKSLTVLDELLGYVMEYGSGEVPEKNIVRCTNLYYSMVPRTLEAGSLKLLNTPEEVLVEFEYLDSLPKKLRVIGPIDSHYANLCTKMRAMDRDEEMYKKLEMSVRNTGSSTFRVVEIFELERHGEDTRYKPYENLDKKLLWHGSRFANFIKILSQGLIIKGVARQGSFGTGIYFSDTVQKSMNYCGGTLHRDSFVCMFVCQVALGRCEMLNHTRSYTTTATQGYDSVLGCGMCYPDPKDKFVDPVSGAELATGKLIQSSFRQGLCHNEYVVYNEAQVKMRYLVKFAPTP